jgi:two-component system cell cycle sensor histidine kinase/response regulator CckA
VVNRCVEFFRNAARRRPHLAAAQERALFAARFDEAKVQQALTKVLENAVEAFGAAAGQITVADAQRGIDRGDAGPQRAAGGGHLCVRGNFRHGAGIDAGVAAADFRAVFHHQAPPHRGLGLALVYGIITNHGGGVAISSQPGKGTSARIYLPAEKTVVAAKKRARRQGIARHGHGLVVDDESLMLTMAETILSDFGYKVLTANSGQKALAILGQPDTKVDLVITDLVMPGMGGRELMERIRQLNRPAHLHERLCDAGGQATAERGYLQKPFTSTELLLKVKAALARGTGVD